VGRDLQGSHTFLIAYLIRWEADAQQRVPRLARKSINTPRSDNIESTRSITTDALLIRIFAMEDIVQELNELFAGSAPDGLPKDVLAELQSMLRLHSITAQELFYKWESYSMKMGSDDTKLDLNTVRAFKRDVQDSLERETRGKTHQVRGSEKKPGVAATPRAGKTDVFGM
jgi:DNA polymerase alpha subunit B N-terminal